MQEERERGICPQLFVTPLTPRYCLGCCGSATESLWVVMSLCNQAGLVSCHTRSLFSPRVLLPVFAL